MLFGMLVLAATADSRSPHRRLHRRLRTSSDFWLKYLAKDAPSATTTSGGGGGGGAAAAAGAEGADYWHFFHKLADDGRAFHGVDCDWASWGSWGACSAICGTGSQSRSRAIRTLQELGGKRCAGAKLQRRECNHIKCVGLRAWEVAVAAKRDKMVKAEWAVDQGEAQACSVQKTHCIGFIRQCHADRKEPSLCAQCAASTLPEDCAPKELLAFCTEWGRNFHACYDYRAKKDQARITLEGANPLFVDQGAKYVDPGGSCVNTLDATHYGLVVGGDDVDTAKLGQFHVRYSCTLDQIGVHAAKPVMRTVVVVPRGTRRPTPPPTPAPPTTPPPPKTARSPKPARQRSSVQAQGNCISVGTHHMSGCASYSSQLDCLGWTSFLPRSMARCFWEMTPRPATTIASPAAADGGEWIDRVVEAEPATASSNDTPQKVPAPRLATTANPYSYTAARKAAEAFADQAKAGGVLVAPAPTPVPTPISGLDEVQAMLAAAGVPTPPCVDRGAAMRKSCAHYKGTDCVLARTTTTRRRDFGGDAFDNCKKTCGLCVPTPVVLTRPPTPRPTPMPTPYRCTPGAWHSKWTRCSRRCGLQGVKHRWKFMVTADCAKSKKPSTARCNEHACGPNETESWPKPKATTTHAPPRPIWKRGAKRKTGAKKHGHAGAGALEPRARGRMPFSGDDDDYTFR